MFEQGEYIRYLGPSIFNLSPCNRLKVGRTYKVSQVYSLAGAYYQKLTLDAARNTDIKLDSRQLYDTRYYKFRKVMRLV